MAKTATIQLDDSDDDPIHDESQPVTASTRPPSQSQPRSARILPPPCQHSQRSRISRPPPSSNQDATPKAKVRRVASQPGEGFRTDASTSIEGGTQAKRDPKAGASKALPGTQASSTRPSTAQTRRTAPTFSTHPVRSTTPPTSPPPLRPPSINKHENPPTSSRTQPSLSRQSRLTLPSSRAHSKPLKPIPPPPSLFSPPTLAPRPPASRSTLPPRPIHSRSTTPPLPPPPSRRSQQRLATLLSTTSFTHADPRLLYSNLFRLEYISHGNPTYDQANRKPYRPALPSAVAKRGPAPSWSEGDVRGLVGRFGGEEFVARVWARDVRGEKVRRETVKGVEVWLIGREFPFRNVVLVGMVVEVTEKDDKIVYGVDDGTAVIECVCELPKQQEFPHASLLKKKSLETDDATKKSSTKVESASVNQRPMLDVGTLVRVVGRITEPWNPDWDRTIRVEGIQALRDSNAESQHHLLVARLHEEVYSKRFDLDAVLTKIAKDERAAEQDWGGSQATASEAGTPKKRSKLTRPHRLDTSDITFDNFKYYILHHLRHHFLATFDPHSRPSSPTKQDANAPWALDDSLPLQDLPRPFTLASLEARSHLRLFARRLAQSTEAEKQLRRKRKAVVTAVPAKPWIRPMQGDGRFRANVPGWKEGSAKLLPPPTMVGRKRGGEEEEKERKRVKVEDKELEGEALEKAVKRLFVDAIRGMRKDGEIVLAVQEEESLSPLRFSTSSGFGGPAKGRSAMDEPFAAPVAPWDRTERDGVRTPKAQLRFGGAPWALGGDDGDAEQTLRGKQAFTSLSKPGAPWALDGSPPPTSSTLFDIDPKTPRAKQPTVITPSSDGGYSLENNTNSMYEAATESFELVTPSSLAPLVLRLVREELKRGTSRPRGVKEERIREMMGGDSRWEAVAAREGVVEKVMEELVRLGTAEKVGRLIRPVAGRAEWRSTKWRS